MQETLDNGQIYRCPLRILVVCTIILLRWLYCIFVGHGPFSHLFDDMFIPLKLKKKWKV